MMLLSSCSDDDLIKLPKCPNCTEYLEYSLVLYEQNPSGASKFTHLTFAMLGLILMFTSC